MRDTDPLAATDAGGNIGLSVACQSPGSSSIEDGEVQLSQCVPLSSHQDACHCGSLVTELIQLQAEVNEQCVVLFVYAL
jgi:hypothetical protein